MIYVTGDVHADIDIDKLDKLAQTQAMTKDDVVIVAGDMGILWDQSYSRSEQELVKKYEAYPFTTAFVDGNHENHDRLDVLEEVDKWGNKVGFISDSVLHLKRGRVYAINGKTIWAMGGGFSIDKSRRVEFISWWRQEQPSYKQMQEGLYNLDLHSRKVDAIITHTAPRAIFNKMNAAPFRHFQYKDAREELAFQEYLQQVADSISFDNWFFGHFHDDIDVDKKFHCLYERTLDIDGNVILNQS